MPNLLAFEHGVFAEAHCLNCGVVGQARDFHGGRSEAPSLSYPFSLD